MNTDHKNNAGTQAEAYPQGKCRKEEKDRKVKGTSARAQTAFEGRNKTNSSTKSFYLFSLEALMLHVCLSLHEVASILNVRPALGLWKASR